MPPAPLLTSLRVQESEAAIVFIHGFYGDPAVTWGQFPKLITMDSRLRDWDVLSIGYSTRLVPDLVGVWRADAPLERLSLLLHTAAEYAGLARYKSLVLVAHSMGGLITQRALVDHPEFAARVSHVFLFGTPSGGLSKSGPFAFLKRQFRDMSESGEFIVDLRRRWNERFGPSSPFRFWAIAGDQDEFVPSVSSLKPFALPQQFVVPGNHTSIVKPKSDLDLGVKIVLNGICGDAAPAGPGNAARVAIESREFLRAAQMLEPIKSELDPRGLVDLALALEATGRQEQAIAILETNLGTNTDAMGVLAGRLKRRWLVEHRREDAARALELYRKGYESSCSQHDDSQALYHGVNVAFMELAYDSSPEAARNAASQVLEHCRKVPRNFWCVAAEAEANLILGETATAIERYREAAAKQPAPRWLRTMCQQALRTADLLGNDEALARLKAICLGKDVETA
jgi:pimeloyl-ACP methyl ester carboxylesterase